MKRYTKIPPDEWIGEWGLTWTEGAILADMLVWDCTLIERAERCFVTEKKVRQAIKKFNTIDGAKELLKSGTKFQKKVEQSSTSKRNKVPHQTEQSSTFSKEKKKIPPTPPIKNKKKIQQEQLLFSPSASDGGEENPPKKRENKYTPEQQKFHGELRDIYLEEWKRYNNDDFNWSPAAMANTIKVIGQIKFKMEKEGLDEITNDKLKDNFRIFIQQMFKNLPWYRQNGTPQIIYSKFNEIYIQLKNGKPSSNTADNFHVFGSRNITPDILAEFT